jgi:hypothetical protein
MLSLVVVGRDDAMSAKGLRCLHYAEKRTFGLAFSTSALCQRTNPLARERAARGAEFVATTEDAVEIG